MNNSRRSHSYLSYGFREKEGAQHALSPVSKHHSKASHTNQAKAKCWPSDHIPGDSKNIPCLKSHCSQQSYMVIREIDGILAKRLQLCFTNLGTFQSHSPLLKWKDLKKHSPEQLENHPNCMIKPSRSLKSI